MEIPPFQNDAGEPMRAKFPLLAVVGGCLCVECAAQSLAGEAAKPLLIRLYVAFEADQDTVKRAVSEASHILHVAGVATEWEQRDSGDNEAHTLDQTSPAHQRMRDPRNYLAVRLVRSSVGVYEKNILGFALPFATSGCHVSVFYDRAEKLAASQKVPTPTLVGYLMAHEIGHILLDSPGHASSGLMKANWDERDLLDAARGWLRFTRKECARLQEGAVKRQRGLMAAQIRYSPK